MEQNNVQQGREFNKSYKYHKKNGITNREKQTFKPGNTPTNKGISSSNTKNQCTLTRKWLRLTANDHDEVFGTQNLDNLELPGLLRPKKNLRLEIEKNVKNNARLR